MRLARTAIATGVLPYADTDRPDPDDESIRRLSREYGFAAESISDLCEEVANSVFTRTGERAPLADVIAAVEVTLHEQTRGAV